MDSYASYQMLIQPSWAPPAWVFGPVWTLLYAIIAVTYGTVFYKVFTKELPAIVALPFALNLVFNFAYTWLQFGLKNNYLASIDVVLVLATLIWALVAIWPHMLWVSFATILQLTITYLNK